MNLDLEISKVIGRIEKDLCPEIIRPLDEEDLLELQRERGEQKPKELSSLTRLSERHRNLARLLAAGKTDQECAIITGYTPSRISILKTDPAMQNLIRHYAEEVDIVFTQVNEKLAQVAGDALDILQERMEDPEMAKEISINQLIEIVKTGADRTGNGPSTKSEVNVQVNIAGRLEEARKRLHKARMIEATAVEVPDGPR